MVRFNLRSVSNATLQPEIANAAFVSPFAVEDGGTTIAAIRDTASTEASSLAGAALVKIDKAASVAVTDAKRETPEADLLKKAAAQDAVMGYVDLFGYDNLRNGWFAAGWVRRPTASGEVARLLVAHFAGGSMLEDAVILFFSRDDVSQDAIGFLAFLPAATPMKGMLRCLTFLINGQKRDVFPALSNGPQEGVPIAKLLPQLRFITSLAEESEPRREMELLLNDAPELSGYGYIEFFGRHAVAGGWLVSGWLSRPWPQDQPPGTLVMSFEGGDLRGDVITTFYARPDLPEGASGVLFFIQARQSSMGQLNSISLRAGQVTSTLLPAEAAPQLREPELVARMKSNLAQARPDLRRDKLFNLISRRVYTGEDTLETLSPNISLHVDEAIRCGVDGVALVGWLMAKPGEIRWLRLHSGSRVTTFEMDEAIKIERHDVLQEFLKHGFDDPACGFIVYLPHALELDGKLYLEVETPRCEVAYRNIGRPVRTGMSAIKHLLGLVDVRFGEMRPAFDRVLGPAVEALNVGRLQTRPVPQIVEYGAVPAHPKFSVIVPLYGRMDFVEYQLALFSARPAYSQVEFIYVLDDPPKRREAQLLFTSIYERFLVPFRAILLDRNVGFAPANNVGLSHARGDFIAYLNSDVFPGTQDWLEQLSDQLAADPTLGAVGPLLLFEDGSVQHRGMFFERLAEYGDWYFCQHLGKGMRYSGQNGIQSFLSITGACMVMRRDLALRAGGFDETYIIGDFEDSDLCLKLISMGYKCAVDTDVRLYHLERKSQSSAALTWRSNLTAYNAWQHERRWAKTISDFQNISHTAVA